MLNLLRIKVVALLFCLFLIPESTTAQVQLNNPMYDYNRKLHFGFTIGFNVGDLSHRYSQRYYGNPDILGVNNVRFAGLTLGAISNVHLTEHMDLRFIPSLILAQRNLSYDFTYRETPVEKEIESVLVDFPLTFKYKSVRHNNVRFYLIAGVKYSIDMASDAGTEPNPQNPIVALDRHNYAYEYGFGFDMYFEYFKFSPEIKISRGINNVLIRDSETVYSNIFQQLFSNFIFISFHFE